jgi:hypothetical protein
MPLRYLLDENLRGPLWQTIQLHNSSGVNILDTVRVGDPPHLPLGSDDLLILRWAESEGRVLVTADRKTMLPHLKAHLLAGHHSPGIFIVRRRTTLSQIVFHLVLAAYAADPMLLRDQIEYIP